MTPERPRHLALFIRSLGGSGGAERSVVNLARGLAERGHRVDLVLGRGAGRFRAPRGVRTLVLRNATPWAALVSLRRDPAALRALAPLLFSARPPRVLGALPALVGYLRRERPEALFSALSFSNVTALLARERAGVALRLVVSEHTHLSAKRALLRRRRLDLLPALIARTYPGADAITAVSEGAAADLARFGGLARSSIEVLPNPVALDEIATLARAPLDHPFAAPGGPPLVLGAGKLDRQKDFATLLRAFARLRAQRPARLAILGDGPERARLAALARELGVERDLALPGFAANPFAWMARAAVLALSSRVEGLGMVLVEALACGCPAVATDCPSGPAEILEGGRVGPLVAVGDDAALAVALARTLDAPPPPERLRARAEHYALDRVTARALPILLG